MDYYESKTDFAQMQNSSNQPNTPNGHDTQRRKKAVETISWNKTEEELVVELQELAQMNNAISERRKGVSDREFDRAVELGLDVSKIVKVSEMMKLARDEARKRPAPKLGEC